MTTFLRTTFLLGLLTVLACNTDEPSAGRRTTPEGCIAIEPTNTPISRKSDSSLDTTAHEVWPNRIGEGPPLTADEHLRACAILSACLGSNVSTDRSLYLELCLSTLDPSGNAFFYEERAIHTAQKPTRWAVEARQILADKGSCDNIKTNEDTGGLPSCEEDGCLTTCATAGKITCHGNIATYIDAAGNAHTRDCALALTACDTTSPTGCTDRIPTACEHPALDACDGNVRLGCDGNGRVSFHDCARVPGGTCQPVDGVGTCVYPDAKECMSGEVTCSKDTLSACFEGKKYDLSCTDLGLGPCDGQSCTPLAH